MTKYTILVYTNHSSYVYNVPEALLFSVKSNNLQVCNYYKINEITKSAGAPVQKTKKHYSGYILQFKTAKARLQFVKDNLETIILNRKNTLPFITNRIFVN